MGRKGTEGKAWKVTPSDVKRFSSKVLIGDGCWEWVAACDSGGYGVFHLDKRTLCAHRISYEIFVGEIPEKHELHHTCNNRKCVRPDHLRALLPADHPDTMPDLNRRKTHCKRGHPLVESNIYRSNGKRGCRTCSKERYAANVQRQRRGR